jgi:hypothetical protein
MKFGGTTMQVRSSETESAFTFRAYAAFVGTLASMRGASPAQPQANTGWERRQILWPRSGAVTAGSTLASGSHSTLPKFDLVHGCERCKRALVRGDADAVAAFRFDQFTGQRDRRRLLPRHERGDPVEHRRSRRLVRRQRENLFLRVGQGHF